MNSRHEQTSRNLILSIAASILLAWSITASGASLTFYGLDNGVGAGPHPNSDAARANFVSHIWPDTLGTENFEGDPTMNFHGGTVGVTFPPTSVAGTVVDLSTIHAEIQNGSISSVFPISGSQFLFIGTVGNSQYFNLAFGSPQTALGFYMSGLSNYFGAPGQYSPIQISFDGGTAVNLFNVTPTAIHDASVSFFGIVTDTPFSIARVFNPLGTLGDEGGFDDIMIGRNSALPAVPEPSTTILLFVSIAVHLIRRTAPKARSTKDKSDA